MQFCFVFFFSKAMCSNKYHLSRGGGATEIITAAEKPWDSQQANHGGLLEGNSFHVLQKWGHASWTTFPGFKAKPPCGGFCLRVGREERKKQGIGLDDLCPGILWLKNQESTGGEVGSILHVGETYQLREREFLEKKVFLQYEMSWCPCDLFIPPT